MVLIAKYSKILWGAFLIEENIISIILSTYVEFLTLASKQVKHFFVSFQEGLK